MFRPETVRSPVNGMATALMAHLSTAFSAVTGQGAKGTELHAMHPVTRIKSLVTAHEIYPWMAQALKSYSQKTAAGRILYFGVIRDYKKPVGPVGAARGLRAESFSRTSQALFERTKVRGAGS